jgi:hypothetical protein
VERGKDEMGLVGLGESGRDLEEGKDERGDREGLRTGRDLGTM